MNSISTKRSAVCSNVFLLGVPALLVFTAGLARANTGVNAEGVSDYSYASSSGEYPGTGNIQGKAEATGFYNGIVATGTGWTGGYLFTDPQVYDTDFMDPDVSGGSASDNDTTYFDKSTAAIGFFSGHGTCDDATGTACTTTSQCPSGGSCPGNPPTASSSACLINTPRRFVTSSQFSSHGDTVYYGLGHVKWGEDGYSGTFGGAGSNGGLMAAFVVNSCSTRPAFFSSQLQSMYAGIALINWVLPISNVTAAGTSDNWAWSNRGSQLATETLANQNAPVRWAWAANLDDAGTIGQSCPDKSSTTPYTYGGGGSITGCGGNFSVAFDVNQTDANWDVNTMTWINAQSGLYAATGNAYQANFVHCNYDCITYPMTK